MSSTSEQLRPRAFRADLSPVNRWKSVQAPHSYGLYADRLQDTVASAATIASVASAASAAAPEVRILPPALGSVPELQKDVSRRFGRRLRSDMARRFGIDRSFISDVERGRKSISLPMLEVLALGLDLSLSELFRDL